MSGHGMPLRSPAQAKAQLDALYAELPGIDCQRKCESSCGPILMSYVEWQRIIKKLGYAPVAPKPNPLDPRTLNCPMLQGGLCSVYSIRPIICRLWGIVETMPCPWGCKPERTLTAREGYVFIQRAAIIGAESAEAQRAQEAVLEHLEGLSDDEVEVSKLFHVRPTLPG